MRIVVLISGSGSNLQALIDSSSNGKIAGHIVAVISNRPGVKGLDRATDCGIENTVVDHTFFESREAFDQSLKKSIDHYDPQLVVLAGFMRILTPKLTQHYLGRMLNIHPSLLPKYPGLNTHQRAIDAGDTTAGATVHFVTGELDGGPTILQGEVPILPNDTAPLLADRVLNKEHIIYPEAVSLFTEGRLTFREGKAWLDDQSLPPNGILPS